ncbi:zonular occludens toxin domain-containing protein [Neisseria meningitidis]|uniref:zonular occludens toxin domain-containing protein n=1 Tax=Neisseria meningitidis TaxID=487 RepID=UPI001F07F42F|nr:zonular occludens toxin domain-containing protein [Neisseria meningitidis]
MITLITGVPGSGKTLSVVSDLAKKINNEWKDRKIFIEGIPELTIETTPIPEGHSINDMHVWLQYPENNGSVVIIDEAQNVFPAALPCRKSTASCRMVARSQAFGHRYYPDNADAPTHR